MTDRIFITGGTGYLGGQLVRALAAEGREVRMLARRPASGLPALVEVVQGDLSDPVRLAAQIRGCRTVFHCAALVAAWARDEGEFYQTNLDGLCHIIRACETAGVRTLVYTSSFFALGPAVGAGAGENAPLGGEKLHPYQHSKLLARIAAVKALGAGFPIVILYPGVIYGPGAVTQGNLVARLVSDFLCGRMPGLLGDGRQLWSFAYIDDVVRGHLLAECTSPSGGEYVLGGENVPLREFFSMLAELTRRKAPRLGIPLWIAKVFAGAQMHADRLRGCVPGVTPSSVGMMYLNWACDSGKACRELGYQFRPLRQGLRETLASMGIRASQDILSPRVLT
ncbi:MAG: NAD-dependent epimerase/dehydratase family protein [Acidobacteria bacterium]|nr:NAD-dependent epimerase/dehydratase family protein [Acidobacteriota bacterium]